MSLMVETVGLEIALRRILPEDIIENPRLRAYWRTARDAIKIIVDLLPDNNIAEAQRKICESNSRDE